MPKIAVAKQARARSFEPSGVDCETQKTGNRNAAFEEEVAQENVSQHNRCSVVTKAGAPTQLLRRASGKRRVNDRSTGFYSVAGSVIFSIRTSTPQLNDFEDIIILGGGLKKRCSLHRYSHFQKSFMYHRMMAMTFYILYQAFAYMLCEKTVSGSSSKIRTCTKVCVSALAKADNAANTVLA